MSDKSKKTITCAVAVLAIIVLAVSIITDILDFIRESKIGHYKLDDDELDDCCDTDCTGGDNEQEICEEKELDQKVIKNSKKKV